MKIYQRLTIIEREEISRYLVLSYSCRQIAITLKRSTSTISREIKRCQINRLKYRAVLAHYKAWKGSDPKRGQSDRKLLKKLKI